jgi:hypothetical protein
MRYWWVNHAQTVRQEREGNYLWSPKVESNGNQSRFYDNMRRAAPGDIVLSYANGLIGKVGVVADFALTAPKPSEFGSTGAYWNSVGWLLPISWNGLKISVRPKAILPLLSVLLPKSHSPISASTGDGNQKAYLAEVGREVAEVIFEAASFVISDVTAIPHITVADLAATLDNIIESSIEHDSSLDSTTRQQLIRARIGQGIFRGNVLDTEPVCRLTGVDKPTLLIASHLKPWRLCSTAAERLDGFNGLMLAPHADFLFDRGLVSFDDDGVARFSSQLSEADANKLGLYTTQRPPPKSFHHHHIQYLEYHRSAVFVP